MSTSPRFAWDIETYKHAFTVTFMSVDEPHLYVQYQISDYKDERYELLSFLKVCATHGVQYVGFNNLAFDYPVMHWVLNNIDTVSPLRIHRKANEIIRTLNLDGLDAYKHQVRVNDRYMQQIDLFKINHFDNKARRTGLKQIEFVLRIPKIVDLPLDVEQELSQDDVNTLLAYNLNDVAATVEFYKKCSASIAFRDSLIEKASSNGEYVRDFLNMADTKIGKAYFIDRLAKSGIHTREKLPDGSTKIRQTLRTRLALKDAVLPWIKFNNPEFERIREFFLSQEVYALNGVFKDLTATVDGLEYVFGAGGIHAARNGTKVEPAGDEFLESVDVSSYYPNLAIQNGFYPEHLGSEFVKIYEALYLERKSYPKKSAESQMFKLALNGTYGESNNAFGEFYDPLFTCKITLNGQLLLAKLAENLMEVPSVRIVMCNTDGLEYLVKRCHAEQARVVCKEWETLTRLQLEYARYSKMFIRDVNSYIAVFDDGKIKRKGAFGYELGEERGYHQDMSALIVPKVAELVLVYGADAREKIESWTDAYDFMMFVKVKRNCKLLHGGIAIQKSTRCYVSKTGAPLTKVLPPLKGKDTERQISIFKGYGVTVCNDGFDITEPIDFDFYVSEVDKLCRKLLTSPITRVNIDS